MSADTHIWNWAEAYTNSSLSEAEGIELNNRLATDVQFASEFNEAVNLLRSLDGSGKHKQFAAMLQDIHKVNNPKKQKTSIIPFKTNYWRVTAFAASIALITSLGTYWVIQYNNNKIASQYSLLRRDLEKYKHSQNQLIKDIKTQQSATLAEDARYTGTGFAVSNDGYLVTNYHVTEGADSVYIQTSKGDYYKASLVSFDAGKDIALLKVEDKHFRFGKSEVPYTFSSGKKSLGAKVFTLGYPGDEVVYNEGYISSKNGFEGDSAQYRLEISAEQGQSGAPVLDARGNIIGIITGKKTESEGTTYAVSSKALLEVLNSLPNDVNLRIPKANKLQSFSREQQIEKLEQYTCAVKVYKK
jgi:serine protease Do